MLIGIEDLEWKRVKNASQRPESLFIDAQKSVILACKLCKTVEKKTLRPLQKL
jgi:hypothetical protein